MEPYEKLENLSVASPCSAKWSDMQGDYKVRFCALCGLNVYNLSAMKRKDAEAFIAEREGKACVRFYRRADGTVLTSDCPIGLRAVRLRLAKLAGVLSAFLGVAGLGTYARSAYERWLNGPELPPAPAGVTMGGIAVRPTMGKPAFPSPRLNAGME
ncbi:MAG: hypothetical protein HY553_08195 [Elusimicrobia bacterium]|nr:hypothetical protein [Elusimicrobiota bacterium]